MIVNGQWGVIYYSCSGGKGDVDKTPLTPEHGSHTTRQNLILYEEFSNKGLMTT